MKTLYTFALCLAGSLISTAPVLAQTSASIPSYTTSQTVAYTGVQGLGNPGFIICGGDFASSTFASTWGDGSKTFAANPIPGGMEVSKVSLTVYYQSQLADIISVNLNGSAPATFQATQFVAASTGYSSFYEDYGNSTNNSTCQSATVDVDPTSYLQGQTNTINMAIGSQQGGIAVSNVRVDVTYTYPRCGPRDSKVVVCHKGHALCISYTDLASHTAHGDAIGSCGTANKLVATTAPVTELTVSPNPAAEVANVSFRAASTTEAQLEVYNQYGTRVATLSSAATAGELSTLSLDSHNLPAGIYMVRLLVDGQVKTTRLEIAK